MKHNFLGFLFLLAVHSVIAQDNKNEDVFIVKPYLQIGRSPDSGTLQLHWQASDINTGWSVEYKTNAKSTWKKTETPKSRRVSVAGTDPSHIYSASFIHLMPGSTFNYRVLQNGKIVFTSEAKALKSAAQDYRFVVFGDIGAGTIEQKPLAYRAFLSKPDLVVVPGDIVYDRGLISEYSTKFWPIYNANNADEAGAPLMRSVLFVSAPGNHDILTRDLDMFPDGLAYYIFWDQPLNGPGGKEGGPSVPKLKASELNRKNFIKAAGKTYPRMANFSFNYGNAHWTFLDSNPYVDWTDKGLTKWLTNDLAAAKNAVWRFVVFHHPGFNSSRVHFNEQQMRILSPVFEAGKVDVVFNGHVHNYQRSFPLRFVPEKQNPIVITGTENKRIIGRVVNGSWTLDKSFDGKTDTSPNGIIYLVTGAGGQTLYNPEQNNDPASWQEFTDKFISNVHSLTVANVKGKTLTIQQLSADGKELDSFKIVK